MNNSYSVYTKCIRWLLRTLFKCVAYCIHPVMISEPMMFVSHPFKPACVKLSTSYRASEKWNQSALICHVWLGIFIYLFILPARLFCACFARFAACSSGSYSRRSCRLSDEHSALHCSIIPSTANHHKALSSCWLAAIPPCWGFSSSPSFSLLSCCIPRALFM